MDPIKVLITGDVSGITAAMKQALNVVQGGVSAMNDQTVDWTSIFTRAVSPAIISSVASVFAFAIAQSVDFQAAMATTGTAAGETSSQIAAMGQSALGLSTVVPSSAQDIANSMAQVSSIFSNTADQQTVVAAMAELAASGFGSLNDITSTSIDLFKQFGVTTTAQAINVLTDLMHSAEAAKESIPELGKQFTSFSDQLPSADKNLDTFNGLISTFGAEIQNLGAAGAQQIFQALADSSHNAAGPMEIMGQSFDTIQKSLLTNGGLEALSSASTYLQRMGPDAALVATNFGLSATQVGQFQTNADKLPKIATDAKTIATNTQTIGDAYAQSATPLRSLQLLWDHFLASSINLGTAFSPVVGLWATDLNSMLTEFDTFASEVKEGWDTIIGDFTNGGWTSVFKDILTGVGTAFQNTFKNPLSSAPQDVLNQALFNTGVGFTGSALKSIDSKAANSSSGDLTSSLISALQTGIKQGQYTTLNSTFNLQVPQGSQGLTAKQIAAQLYAQFQGTSQ